MHDELYPPGMAPPGKQPVSASARERKPIAAPARAQEPLPQAAPQSDLDPPDSNDFVPDFSEVLPDEALPPLAEATSLPLAISLAIPLAGQSLPESVPVAIPLDQVGPTGPAGPLSAASLLRAGVAPSAARVSRKRQNQSAKFIQLTIAGCVAVVALLGVAYVLLTNQARHNQQPLAENRPALPALPNSPPEATTLSHPVPVPAAPPPAPATKESPVAAVLPQAPPTPASDQSITPVIPAPSPPPPASPAPTATLAELQPLVKALEAAKSALAEQNFKAADTQLAKAASLATLPTHQAAVARLQEVGGYVKQFRHAVASAVGGMQAGESFKVGNSTQVSFVEATADKVVLRIAGMNKTYPLGDLPPGLALAIADFKLPASDPTSRVVKGADWPVHKRADRETQAKAAALWQEAQAAGKDLAHLLPFANDHYASLLQDARETTQ